MKKSSIILFVFIMSFFSTAFSQNITQIVQPGCFYRLTDRSGTDPADSLFTTPDSSYKTTYYNGNRCICKGLWVADGSDTGVIMVHPNYNTDTTVRYPLKIGAFDLGYAVPFTFDKIFKTGTTVPLDSIGYFPDVGK